MSRSLARALLLLVSGFVTSLRGDDVALIGVGENWRYWPATTEPAAVWNSPDFNDAEWISGDSGFGLSSWGENTIFNGLQRGSGAVYFRKAFQVGDPAAVATLTLRCDWQGGFVAFLNGVEVVRRNLPGPAGALVPYDALASPRYAGAAEEIPIADPAALLRPGRNLLALQVQPVFGSAMDVVLVPELLANFTRGPLLQSVLQDRATVMWRTPGPLAGRVEFGTNATLEGSQLVEAPPGEAVAQEVTLNGLQPGTRYFYRVIAGAAASPMASFRTLPAAGDLDFLLLGDSGSGNTAQFSVARLLARRQPDLVMHLGDVVYPYFTSGQTDTRCLSVYRGLLRTTPFFFTWGNHDLYAGVAPFLAAFRQPTNNTSAADHLVEGTRPEFYYSFDAGDAHFAVLFQPYTSQYYLRENCPQLRWLEADLAASTKPWKFLCLHHPVNTSGGHRFDDYNYNRIPDRTEIAARLMPLAGKYGVQMIFAGHDHNYERFHPVQQTHSVVTGGGGIILYGLVERDPNSAVFQSRWHYSAVQLRGDTLRLVATDWQGVAFDALEFRRTPAGSDDPDGDGLGPVAEAALGTRADSPDTDGDGRGDGWEWVRGFDPKTADVAENGGPLTDFLSSPLPRPEAELFARNLAGGGLELRWLGRVGRRVVLESAAIADGGWEAIPSFLAGGSLRTDRQAFLVPTAETTRFFRIRLVPE